MIIKVFNKQLIEVVPYIFLVESFSDPSYKMLRVHDNLKREKNSDNQNYSSKI